MAGDLPASHNVDGGHPVDDSESPYVDSEPNNVYGNTAKYNIYAKQLFPLRHGYPLMSPASTDHNGKLVTPQIGDVGCLQEGEFIRLFNATTLPESDTRADQRKFSGIPDGLEPFPNDQYIPREPERAFESHLCSDGVRLVGSQEVPDQGDSTTPLRQESTTSFKFECSENAGAFVRIGDGPATSSDILLSRRFIPFMQTNIEGWYQHIINDLDFDTARQRIMFVSGVTRAADWFTGAFSAKGRDIVFSETPGGGGMGSEPREIHRQDIHDVECKDQRRIEKQAAVPLTGPDGGAKLLEEQTLFFHYYKMKARSWSSGEDENDYGDELEHEYPSPEDCNLDEHEREWDVTQEPLADQAAYDPVDYLLDYILDYPMEGGRRAQMAIASDLHIYALFPDGKVPLDIREELYKLRPEIIFVHEEVACLAVAQWAEVHPDVKNSVANELDDGESGTFEPTGPDGIEAAK